jgi:hypothetical protein
LSQEIHSIEKIRFHAYRLDTPPGIHNVFHTWLLRPAADDPFPSQTRVDWQPPAIIISDDGEETFEVEAILDEREVRRGQGRRRELLVKWTGYAEPTWEPADAMEEVAALDEFERLRGLESEEGGIVRGYNLMRALGAGRNFFTLCIYAHLES